MKNNIIIGIASLSCLYLNLHYYGWKGLLTFALLWVGGWYLGKWSVRRKYKI